MASYMRYVCLILAVFILLSAPLISKADKEDETVKKTTHLLNIAFIADWEKRAMQAYREEEPVVAIWALKNLINLLSDSHQALSAIEKSNYLQSDLVLAYGRLALSYKAAGNNQKYQDNILKSLELAKQKYNKETMTEEDIIDFVNRADRIGQESK